MKYKGLVIGFLIIFFNGCVFLPKAAKEDVDCTVKTKKLVMDANTDLMKVLDGQQSCDTEACLALVVPMLAVSAGTFVISGSIVIAGNTANWLELQSTCPKKDWEYKPASNIGEGLKSFWNRLMSV